MWRQASIEDVADVERFVALMRRMDGRYQEMTVAKVRSSMRRHAAELYLGEFDDAFLGLLLMYSEQKQRYFLWSVGATGTSPGEALDRMADFLPWFLARHDAQEVLVIRPRTMDYPPIKELHDAVPLHPAFRIEVIEESGDTIFWSMKAAPWSGTRGTPLVHCESTCSSR